MASDKKKSLGRNPFDDQNEEQDSRTVRRLIKGKALTKPGAKEVVVSVRLTPASIKHLDKIRAALEKRGHTKMSRDDLIRIAITLLSAEDIA